MATQKKDEKSKNPQGKKEVVAEKEGGEKQVSQKEEPEEQEKQTVPSKFKKIVEQIEKMSVLDLSELVKILEKRFGVSAAAPQPVVAGSGAPVEAAEEKTEFDVVLKEIGDKKIEVIKAVRDITGKGLRDSKDLVDSAPTVIKEKVKTKEAEEIKKKLEAAGATVELK